MPRSSRHKSHKQKHSSRDLKEHTDSEEEELLKERRRREDSGIRVSDSAEKREREIPLQSQKEKDLPPDYGASRRKKDRDDSSSVTDRWNGGEDKQVQGSAPEKDMKDEGFGSDLEKRPKSKVAVDSKSQSSRRQESLGDRKDEILTAAEANEDTKKGSGRVESKRKSDKDSGRKEASEHKDAKEKDRGVDRDRRANDTRRERSVDVVTVTSGGGSEVSRKQEIRTHGSEEDRHVKREVEITEWQVHDELRNPELEKELEKRMKRRDGAGDKDKWQEDVGEGDDRRVSSRDDRLKNGRCKDERHKDGKYRDKYREDLDRDHRYRDDLDRDNRYRDNDKHRHERSRDRTVDRSDNKHPRDEIKSSESRHKKAKLHGSDREGSPGVDDRGNKHRDSRGRKRSSENNEDHSDLKSRSSKEQRADVEKALSSSKLDSLTDRGRSESHRNHSDVADHVPPNDGLLKSSSSSSAHAVKDQCRHGSRQPESRDPFIEERHRPHTASSGEVVSPFGGTNKVLDSLPTDKRRQIDDGHSTDLLTADSAVGPQYGRSPKIEHQFSPSYLTEKSPSSTSGSRPYSNRSVRKTLDMEETSQRSSGFKDARDYPANKDRSWELPVDKHSELNGEPAAVGLSNCLPSRSPSLPPLPPFRHGLDSPSVLTPSEDDARGTADRKSNNRFRRTGDPSMGRGQGNAWKGVPTWPSPVSNGFIPFQHGLPPGGFHAVMQQFPAPLFGVRPSMELNHPGISYPIHDTDRFSGHVRPFGWRAPTDDSFPHHLHGWDGNNGVFGDESQIYGRAEWDQNRHLSNRGWEIDAEMWKGQNGNVMELPSSKGEPDYSAHVSSDEHGSVHSGHRYQSEKNLPEDCLPGSTEKRSDITSTPKVAAEESPKIILEKTPEDSKISSSASSDICCAYLSMLDISADLTSPELYKQFMSMLGKEGNITERNDAISQIFLEERMEVAGPKSFNQVPRDSLFPTKTKPVFQRTMDLYKKQKTQMRAKIPLSLSDGSKLDKVSSASGEEKLGTTEVDSSLKHALPCLPSNDEGDRTSSNSKGNLFDDVEQQQADTVSVSGPVILADASEAFEALMPESFECRVNLSRIPNPENTH